MTRDQKLEVHLEFIIFEDLPPGTRLNVVQMFEYTKNATIDQKRRAFERGLQHAPLLLDEEREPDV